MRRSLYLIYFLFLFLVGLKTEAQDLQYSQYYNAPLFLNPAFAGSADNSRAVFNFRNQWPGLGKPYRTFSFSLDHLIEPYNSGVGIMFRKDAQGEARLNATEVGLIYSYLVGINDRLAFMPALQASYISRDFNYQNLTFGDQIDVNDPLNRPPSTDQLAERLKVSFLDFSFGAVAFSDVFWAGVSVNHLNRPNQAFGADEDRLALKTSLNFGYKFYFDDPTWKGYREKSLIPTFLYKAQGKYDQLDVGLYGVWDPIMIGLWYRGLPVKKYSREFNNNDAIIAMVGFNLGNLAFAYSYDFTISSLASYSNGAHEISLIYEWYKPYKVKKKRRAIPCPKFYGNRLKN